MSNFEFGIIISTLAITVISIVLAVRKQIINQPIHTLNLFINALGSLLLFSICIAIRHGEFFFGTYAWAIITAFWAIELLNKIDNFDKP